MRPSWKEKIMNTHITPPDHTSLTPIQPKPVRGRRRSRSMGKFLKEQLLTQGFVFFRAAEIGIKPANPAFDALVTAAKTLPLDPHAKVPNRFRCFHHAVFTPWNGQLSFVPASIDPKTGEAFVPYLQGDENPEQAGVVRRFAPMPVSMQKNPALRRLVKADFELTPFADDKSQPIAVTFHVIRHTVTPGHKAVASPDLVHRDDVLLSVLHVIERSKVTGGRNCITKPEHAGKPWTEVPIQDIYALATVTDLFDGYAFIDDKVAHYVSAVEAEAQESGARTVLIVDFAPMKPVKKM
jgi:hypothetical protein